ncbi:MAG: hypothetical protein WD898_02155 [Candidatus Paceibacterota bacterium]
MKPILTMLVVISFLGMAVLGFWTMNHATGHTACAASLAQGSLCPNSVLSFISFHVNAFRTFSSAILGQLVLLFLAMILLASPSLVQPPWQSFPENRLRYTGIIEQKPPNIFIQLLSWFSLHEKRDPSPSF